MRGTGSAPIGACRPMAPARLFLRSFCMRIPIDRRSALPLCGQIVAQIELLILGGELLAQDRLPSVRCLARRLATDRGTVHAAYRQLEENGNVELRPGSGAFVRRGERSSDARPASVEDALQGAARLALRSARPLDMRRVADAWLAGEARGVATVDPAFATAQVMAAELGPLRAEPVRAFALAEVERRPDLLNGRITLTLPFHAARLDELEPRPCVVVLKLGSGPAHARQVSALPSGSRMLLVSHSPRVLPYARAYVEGMRGDEVLMHCVLFSERREWTRRAAAADLVVADALAFRDVASQRPDAAPFRLLEHEAVANLRSAFGGLALRSGERGLSVAAWKAACRR